MKPIFYEQVQWVSKIINIIVFYREKIKFLSSSRHVIFFLLYRQEYVCTNNSVNAGNDVIDILTSSSFTCTDARFHDCRLDSLTVRLYDFWNRNSL